MWHLDRRRGVGRSERVALAVLARAAKVLTIVRVDLDLLADVDEDGHVDRSARLQFGLLLNAAARRVALDTRLRLRHLDDDGLGHLQAYGLQPGCIGLLLGCIGLQPGCIGLQPRCMGSQSGCIG